MEHDVILLTGRARNWYWDLAQEVLRNHVEVPCRQGLALESPHSLIAILPATTTIFDALSTVDVPRRKQSELKQSEQRVTFSILYSLRRILGYHDTVLFDKYPVLQKYTLPHAGPYYARSIFYTRDQIPEESIHSPYISRGQSKGGTTYFIDQIKRAVYLLSYPETRQSKRALVDFGEGFKARCVMSWLFLIRNDQMRIYQHMRSNDLVVGMPNNLIDARLGQLVMAAITGSSIGEIHYQSSIIQIYKKDIAGVDCVVEMSKLSRDNEDEETVLRRIRDIPIIRDVSHVLAKDIGCPTTSIQEGLSRYDRILAHLEELFWSYNPECSSNNRACISHLMGRYKT